MTTRIIIARHGNTFTKDQTPTRVGARTDLDLVEEHRGRSVGKYLKDNGLVPDEVFSGPLKRHIQTAEFAIEEMKPEQAIRVDNSFNEIDYGVDENKPEEEVIARLGQEALDKWNKHAIVPEGWDVDPDALIAAWKDFANLVEAEYKGQTVAMFSSNGIIRFAPHITGDFDSFAKEHDIKVATGGVCIFEKEDGDARWKCTAWNIKAYKNYQ